MRRIALLLLAVTIPATSLTGTIGSSHYTKMTDVRVPMSDGVVLAADVYVPTVPDADGDDLYPCVVELTPYRKESRASEGVSYLPGEGIALIEVDARGTGGSGGEYDIVFSVREQADAAEWIEWAATAATKPDGSELCEETVGMYGGSYSGIIQYLVATLPAVADGDLPAAPPHLAAIAPQRAYGDLYRDIVYHGGMVIGSFGTIWSSGTTAYYTQPPTDVTTPAGQLAWLDHFRRNDPMLVPYLMNQYADASFTSDDTRPSYTQRLYADSSALPRVENLRVPALHLSGWYDSFTRGQLELFMRAHELERQRGDRGPNHLIVGPWNHTGTHFISPDQGFKSALGDWYRYWLEGRASGAPEPSWFAGPRVRYFQMRSGAINSQSAADGEWRTAETWPPSEVTVGRLFLRGDGSIGDPVLGQGARSYVSNPTAGTGETLGRWDNAAGTPHMSWDQRTETGRGLTYQTPPLTEPIAVAGPIGFTMPASVIGQFVDEPRPHGIGGIGDLVPAHLDTDFVVKISDVAPDGSARLVTQGYLRASHRAVDRSRSILIGGELMQPWHPHTRASLDPPEIDAPAVYEIGIWPIAKTFGVGHRLRVDIYSADTPNHLTILKPTLNRIEHGLFDPELRLPLVTP